VKSRKQSNADSAVSAIGNTSAPKAPASSPLRSGIEDWKEITPPPLQKAIEALRRNFEKQAWNVGAIMRRGCYPALHKGLAKQAREISRLMEQKGYPALPTVDDGQTEPAVFSSYFYSCADLLARALRRTFSDLRDIALAQSTMIDRPAVEWAAIQAKTLAEQESPRISVWLKDTCDKQSGLVDDDFEWKSWRAPRWLSMQPFANPPYDRATAWERVDEADTKHVLKVVEDRFNLRLTIELDKAVDEAHLQQAKRGIALVSAPEHKPLSPSAQKGRDYLQVRKELGRIKQLARHRGLSMGEIRTENPGLLVWKFANALSDEDRDVFESPRTWESGYVVDVFLAKYYGRSPATMKKWVAAFRHESPTQTDPSQEN
jgi:hypothetical protein